MKICRHYKTIEPVVLHIMLRTKSVIVAGLYRPPESLTGAYQQQLEDKLNHICNCNWASLQGKMVVLLGDPNLDRLFPHKAEAKL